MRASIESACTSKPSARAIGAPAAASLAAAGADPHLGHAAAEVARREARGEARGARRSAGCGWSRRRSRRRPSRSRRRRTGSRRLRRAARAPRRRPRSARGARGRRRWRARCASRGAGDLDEREGGVADRRALDDQLLERARERVAEPRRRARPRRRGCPRRARPGRACRARRARPPGRRTPAPSTTSRSRGPAKPSMPDAAPRAGAWPPARRGCRARRSRRPARPSRCRRRARRSPGRRPSGRPARRRRARRWRGSPGRSRRRARRRADDDVDHAGRARGDDAHHDGARVGRAAAGDVDRGGADRDLAQAHRLALRELDRRLLLRRPRRRPATLAIATWSPATSSSGSLSDRLVELLRRRRSSGAGSGRPVSNRAV